MSEDKAKALKKEILHLNAINELHGIDNEILHKQVDILNYNLLNSENKCIGEHYSKILYKMLTIILSCIVIALIMYIVLWK